MRAVRLVAALAALALLAGGCSGGDDADAGDTGAAATTATTAGGTDDGGVRLPVEGGVDDPRPGRVLLRFVRAAGRGDAEAMWSLLSEPTQASIGPTFEDFRGDAAINFQANLGTLAPTAKVVLSQRLPDDWAVAAVTGESEINGEPEYFGYGAAMLPEDGSLKIELGGVVVTSLRPEPLAKIDDRRPLVGANIGAGGDLTQIRMWLDGEPFPARRGAEDTPFTATLRGRPAQALAPGRHEVVVFAATTETATGTAWTFEIR